MTRQRSSSISPLFLSTSSATALKVKKKKNPKNDESIYNHSTGISRPKRGKIFFVVVFCFVLGQERGVGSMASAVSGTSSVWPAVKYRTAASAASRTWRTSARLEQR